ncbi:MAG TPA: hypothetical protein VJA23_00125 [Candidatus Nanoarchaeia archaeon]|nr:hypothetical protein [Candidatus Nanoarchaeia archaeon]
MTFPFPINKRPPKEVKLHFIEFRLKGYAIQDQISGLRGGYFRSQKPSLRIFDPEFNRKREILINYLEGGNNYSTLWGFKYHPGERIIHCGLDSVVLTVNYSDQRQCGDIVTQSSPRRSYETKFLSAVAESLTQKVDEVGNTPPLSSKSWFNWSGIKTYPKDFQDTFGIALKEDRAFSIKEVYVSICLEHLGVKAGKGNNNPSYLAEEVGGGACRR